MKFSYKIIMSSLLLVGCFCLQAQTQQDFQVAADLISTPQKSTATVLKTSPTNEVAGTLQAMYFGYKTFISSQDGGRCSFHPSCSTFGLLAVQKRGPILGILAAFDRVSRCNGVDTHVYPYQTPNGLLVDMP